MIVSDTHIWLWWIAEDYRSIGDERVQLLKHEDIVAVSAISCFEIAWLERHKRIDLNIKKDEWFELALDGSGIAMLPITPEIACLAVDLPEHHSDPQDRIIIATSLAYDALLMSSDKKFSLYKELKDILI
jgi:PIN domain nuclease of toxin-antitoxin system